MSISYSFLFSQENATWLPLLRSPPLLLIRNIRNRACTDHKNPVPIFSGNLWIPVASPVPFTPEDACHSFVMKCEPCAVFPVSIISGQTFPSHIAKAATQTFCCVTLKKCPHVEQLGLLCECSHFGLLFVLHCNGAIEDAIK